MFWLNTFAKNHVYTEVTISPKKIILQLDVEKKSIALAYPIHPRTLYARCGVYS